MSQFSSRLPTFPRLFVYRSDDANASERRWPNLPPISLGWQLFVLFLLCLIPRIWVACLVRSICHDGYYYLSIASAFRDGNLAKAFSYLDLNIYPLILVGLNSLGLEWMFAGKAWSILISSLVVLPLFGWVRRLFSDQVAFASCFLYSLHAEFVEMSFEPIRDPTFWFLFNLGLYTAVRAISEAKLRWFLAHGIALTLAIHTRSEGWLLLIPLFLWLARQLVVNAECRMRLAGGAAVSLAVLPCVILLINLTVLREESEWQFGRLSHFAVGWNWLKEKIEPSEPPENSAPAERVSAVPVVAESPPPTASPISSTPESALPTDNAQPVEAAPADAVPVAVAPRPPTVKRYLKEMASALEQINLGLLVFGLCWSGRELFNWNRGVLFVLAFTLAAGVWIVYSHFGHLNSRYFFPIYLTLMPYYGIGYLMVFYGLWNGAELLRRSWLKPEYTAIFLIFLAIGLGWVDALTTDRSLREQEANFGEWLEKTHGPFHSVLTDSESTRAGFYAQHRVPDMLHHWSTLTWQFADRPQDLLILGEHSMPPEGRPLVIAEAKKRGLEPLQIPETVCCHDQYWVFIRAPKTPPIAAKPDNETQRN